jgi:polyphosphate kinase
MATKNYNVPYNNKEISWMDFNMRVLEEAFKKENPLMERLNFLSISVSNLDEFFMVRVAGLMDQINSGYNLIDPAGMTPQQQLTKLTKKIHDFSKK